MEGSGGEFLARTGLAVDQDREITGCRGLQQAVDLEHLPAVAQQVSEAVPPAQVGFQAAVFFLEAVEGAGVDEGQGRVIRQGFEKAQVLPGKAAGRVAAVDVEGPHQPALRPQGHTDHGSNGKKAYGVGVGEAWITGGFHGQYAFPALGPIDHRAGELQRVLGGFLLHAAGQEQGDFTPFPGGDHRAPLGSQHGQGLVHHRLRHFPWIPQTVEVGDEAVEHVQALGVPGPPALGQGAPVGALEQASGRGRIVDAGGQRLETQAGPRAQGSRLFLLAIGHQGPVDHGQGLDHQVVQVEGFGLLLHLPGQGHGTGGIHHDRGLGRQHPGFEKGFRGLGPQLAFAHRQHFPEQGGRHGHLPAVDQHPGHGDPGPAQVQRLPGSSGGGQRSPGQSQGHRRAPIDDFDPAVQAATDDQLVEGACGPRFPASPTGRGAGLGQVTQVQADARQPMPCGGQPAPVAVDLPPAHPLLGFPGGPEGVAEGQARVGEQGVQQGESVRVAPVGQGLVNRARAVHQPPVVSGPAGGLQLGEHQSGLQLPFSVGAGFQASPGKLRLGFHQSVHQHQAAPTGGPCPAADPAALRGQFEARSISSRACSYFCCRARSTPISRCASAASAAGGAWATMEPRCSRACSARPRSPRQRASRQRAPRASRGRPPARSQATASSKAPAASFGRARARWISPAAAASRPRPAGGEGLAVGEPGEHAGPQVGSFPAEQGLHRAGGQACGEPQPTRPGRVAAEAGESFFPPDALPGRMLAQVLEPSAVEFRIGGGEVAPATSRPEAQSAAGIPEQLSGGDQLPARLGGPGQGEAGDRGESVEFRGGSRGGERFDHLPLAGVEVLEIPSRPGGVEPGQGHLFEPIQAPGGADPVDDSATDGLEQDGDDLARLSRRVGGEAGRQVGRQRGAGEQGPHQLSHLLPAQRVEGQFPPTRSRVYGPGDEYEQARAAGQAPGQAGEHLRLVGSQVMQVIGHHGQGGAASASRRRRAGRRGERGRAPGEEPRNSIRRPARRASPAASRSRRVCPAPRGPASTTK
ncbi:MAG: hypothetical protein Q9Q13_03665 [Acidobacteriota bacterium]|nr:hypothetical protein [Acidobacteriota bacterium]